MATVLLENIDQGPSNITVNNKGLKFNKSTN